MLSSLGRTRGSSREVCPLSSNGAHSTDGSDREEPPFDRHDWFVQRTTASGEKKEVRYVIDYYSGPPESTGEPVFYLDVRPAVDGPTSACERLIRSGCDLWFRGTGSRVREDLKQENLIDALEKAKAEGRA